MTDKRLGALANHVRFRGKISKVERLRYLPSGEPILVFWLAAEQRSFENRLSVGYFEVVVGGVLAEDYAQRIRVGKKVSIRGWLWQRYYRNRKDERINEVKIIAKRVVEFE